MQEIWNILFGNMAWMLATATNSVPRATQAATMPEWSSKAASSFFIGACPIVLLDCMISNICNSRTSHASVKNGRMFTKSCFWASLDFMHMTNLIFPQIINMMSAVLSYRPAAHHHHSQHLRPSASAVGQGTSPIHGGHVIHCGPPNQFNAFDCIP